MRAILTASLKKTRKASLTILLIFKFKLSSDSEVWLIFYRFEKEAFESIIVMLFSEYIEKKFNFYLMFN